MTVGFFCLLLVLVIVIPIVSVHEYRKMTTVTGLAVAPASITLSGVGTTKALAPKVSPASASSKGLVWSTSEKEVATVDANGVVKAVGGGSCTITARTPNGKTAAARVTVNGPVSANYDNPNTRSSISVLMYHSINYEKNNILRVPKEDFANEMQWLYQNGYKTLSLDELYDHVKSNTPFPKRSVVITLDDGYDDNYISAYPVLKQYGFHATVFMITGKIDTAGYLSRSQLVEMDKNGISIECHTVTHPYLNTLSYKSQYAELSDSKQALETLLGKKVEFVAYPSGKYNSDTLRAVQALGYKMAFKMNGGTGSLSTSTYEFPRMFVNNVLSDFIGVAQNGKAIP